LPAFVAMNRQGMLNLFQLINVLYEYQSIILTTNKEFTQGIGFHCHKVCGIAGIGDGLLLDFPKAAVRLVR
jgi:hypothetical protein